MDFDSSDDEVTPGPPERSSRPGRSDGSGRDIGGAYRGERMSEQNLQKLEYDAYVAVFQAFIKQAGALTWAKSQVMAKLREELRISTEQHLNILRSIESSGGYAPSRIPEGERYAPPPVLGSTDMPQRKQKSSLSHSMKTSDLPSPPSNAGPLSRPAPPIGSRSNKKIKGGPGQPGNEASLNTKVVPPAASDPLIGRRVQTRWPEDNTFYEAVITDYNPERGLHALVYNGNNDEEAWEWINVKELSMSGDLKFIDGPPAPTFGSTKTNVKGNKKLGGRSHILSSGGGARSGSKGPVSSFEDLAPSAIQGRDRKGSTVSHRIQLPSLDALIKQVDRIAYEDDLTKIESVKRAAKEHEAMLRKVLDEVGECSDGESSDGDS